MAKSVFISYFNENKSLMESLSRRIKKEKTLISIVVPLRRDNLKYNPDKVALAIKECDIFIPILTRESLNSQWVNQEVGFAFGINKKCYPLIERTIIEKLKGFINDDRDLPYTFLRIDGDHKKNLINFRKACNLLISDIIDPNRPTIQPFFPGIWKGYFKNRNYTGIIKKLEVRNDVEWYEEDSHIYNISDIDYNENTRILSFIRNKIKGNPTQLYTEIKINNEFNHYVGRETGSKEYGELIMTFDRLK